MGIVKNEVSNVGDEGVVHATRTRIVLSSLGNWESRST